MDTLCTESVEEAAAVIQRGGLCAFPTETVYGLGANVFDKMAVRKIFEAKGRPPDNPLIVHVANKEQIEQVVSRPNEAALRLIKRFFPGPLTVVLEKSESVPESVTAGLKTVGIRMPDHELARQLIVAAGPLVAPSANLSGRPSPTTVSAVLEDLGGRIDCVLRGGPVRHGIESTVVDCTVERPLVLRSGAVTLEQLREVVPETDPSSPGEELSPKSPGLKHKHYSPRATVMIAGDTAFYWNPKESGYIGLKYPAEDFARVKLCESLQAYAASLYEFFRECDREGLSNVYCERVEEAGVGTALMDRIRRAAGH